MTNETVKQKQSAIINTARTRAEFDLVAILKATLDIAGAQHGNLIREKNGYDCEVTCNDQRTVSEGKMKRLFQATILGLSLLVLMTACTAHYPVNNPIQSTAAVERLSLEDKPGNGSDELLLILTFSGGGTRSAAFAYGVLQTLAETHIVIDGEKRRLLDEVDAISSVSGGSFTAAYYGLFNDRIFEDFETKFLKFNVQSELTRRLFYPSNWLKLASLFFERSDLAAEYYDELLFENKTFQDFSTVNSPLIAINATNIANGTQFTFIGKEFALICSDLLSYPLFTRRYRFLCGSWGLQQHHS